MIRSKRKLGIQTEPSQSFNVSTWISVVPVVVTTGKLKKLLGFGLPSLLLVVNSGPVTEISMGKPRNISTISL